MELNEHNKYNFWNIHTLNDFEIITLIKNVRWCICWICFLKDGRIASSGDNFTIIYNKNTFKKEIRIKERHEIYYMNITKNGILITCLDSTYLNLYEIKGKKYNNIQTIRPYPLKIDFLKIFNNTFSITKFTELKNGDIAILAWKYAICFYTKTKKNKNYLFLNKFSPKPGESATDLIELDNNQYIISFRHDNMLQFLDMNSQKITKTIKTEIQLSYSKNNILLMNKNDLFVAGSNAIIVIDIQKKEIVKVIGLELEDSLDYMIKLSYNIILIGCWNNYIIQLEYDENKKIIKKISNSIKKEHDGFGYSLNSIAISSNNYLIVTPYQSHSLIIYKYKNK